MTCGATLILHSPRAPLVVGAAGAFVALFKVVQFFAPHERLNELFIPFDLNRPFELLVLCLLVLMCLGLINMGLTRVQITVDGLRVRSPVGRRLLPWASIDMVLVGTMVRTVAFQRLGSGRRPEIVATYRSATDRERLLELIRAYAPRVTICEGSR